MTKVKELIVKTLTSFHPSFKSQNPFRIKQKIVKIVASKKKRKYYDKTMLFGSLYGPARP